MFVYALACLLILFSAVAIAASGYVRIDIRKKNLQIFFVLVDIKETEDVWVFD